ncbi:hypothetical protein Tco_0948108 [Tanacetum coccineum]
MSHHKRINVTPPHTKKIFENMKREGKGLSGTVTHLFPTMMVQAQEEVGEGSANPTDPHHTPTIIQPSTSQPQKKQSRRKQRKSTEISQSSVPSDNVAEEAANEENVPIHSNDPLFSGEDRLKLNELMKLCTQLQNRVLDLENTKTTQALQITSLKKRVKKLERRKKSRTHGLKRLYKVGLSAKVISSDDEASLGDQEDASKQGRKIHDIDKDEDIYLVNVPRDEDMFGVNDLEGDEVVVESDVVAKKKADEVNNVEEVVSTAGDAASVSAAIITTVELAFAQTLAELKSAKPKAITTAATTTTTTATTVTPASTRPRAKGIIFHDQEQAPAPTPIAPLQQLSKVQDKSKGKMVEEEPEKSTKKKDQIRLDEELAFKIQVKEQEEKRLAREKAQKVQKANIAWDDIQAKVEADYQLAQRLHDEEQEQYTDEEKARFFCEFLEQRRKFFAAKRAEAKRNKPPTQAQQRKLYSTYLKNMEGYTLKQLKGFKFEVIKDMFDRAFRRVNTFVDHEKELIEESSKKAENEKKNSSKRKGKELESDKSKKQKLDEKVEAEVNDAKEAEELKQFLEIVPDDEDDVTVDATPLSVKLLIVDYKIHQEGKKSFFQIIRADGNSQMYLTFTKMLKNFDREDLEVLWRIVKDRFKKTEPVNYMDNFLLLNLKTMFEHHVEDSVWRNQQGLVKVLNWKLFYSCGVHCVTMQSISYFLLVEKMYPLTKHTLHQMFNDVKLQVDYECGMAYELLRLVKKQLKEGYVRQ